MSHVWLVYRVELSKAVRLKLTYVAPLFVVAAVLVSAAAFQGGDGDSSEYTFIAYATPMALDLVGELLLLMYCAILLSAEIGSGSIRLALVRPIARWELYGGKLLLGITYAAALTALVGTTAWAVAFVLGDLTGVSHGGEISFTNAEMRNTYLLAAALTLVPQIAMVAYALCISACTRSPASAMGITIGSWIVLNVVKHPLGIADYVFSTYLGSFWDVFAARSDGLDGTWGSSVTYCIATSLASLVVFTTLGTYVLSRRDFGS